MVVSCLTAKCYLITRITSSFLEKEKRVGFEVEDANVYVQVDVPARTRAECDLQSHVLRAHLGRWTASWSHWWNQEPWAQTAG